MFYTIVLIYNLFKSKNKLTKLSHNMYNNKIFEKLKYSFEKTSKSLIHDIKFFNFISHF